MDIKLITIDIDRTLINDDMRVPKENIDAIQKAVNAGCNVVLCSGRSGSSVRKYMDELNLKGFVPSLGGCMVAKWNGELISDFGIDCCTSLAIYNLAKSYNHYLLVFKGEDWLSDPENTYWNEIEYNATKVKGIFTDIGRFLADNNPNKLLFPSRDPKVLDEVAKKIEKQYGDKVVCFLSSPYYLEIMPKGINKGTAVYTLVDYLKISTDQVLAIGDFYNDVDMFKAAGHSAAPSNAIFDIQNMVEYVSPLDNNHGAVAQIIEKYLFHIDSISAAY